MIVYSWLSLLFSLMFIKIKHSSVFYIVVFVLFVCALCTKCLWIVHSWLHLRFSLTIISRGTPEWNLLHTNKGRAWGRGETVDTHNNSDCLLKNTSTNHEQKMSKLTSDSHLPMSWWCHSRSEDRFLPLIEYTLLIWNDVVWSIMTIRWYSPVCKDAYDISVSSLSERRSSTSSLVEIRKVHKTDLWLSRISSIVNIVSAYVELTGEFKQSM